jgi:outer membrane protein OmpA-like peptidoglycan-associated protein
MKAMNLLLRFRMLAPLVMFLPQAVKSQDTLQQPPAPANYGSEPMSMVMEPTINPYGTVGMSNVVSAEPLGAGRVSLELKGNFYQQQDAFAGTPNKNTDVTTATLGAALGLNPYIDGFIGIGAYNLNGGGNSGSGAGTTFLGAQGSLPLPEDLPLRLGLQVASLFGTAGSQINTMTTTSGDAGAYGYNYLETRKYTDLSAKLLQSLIFGGSDMGLKLHLNEGVISSFQSDKGVLLVTGAGVQFFVAPPLVIGAEINDRTFLTKPEAYDPMWVTPSLEYRSPVHLNIELGGDISISKDRPDGSRTLEPWRGFVAVSFAYDTQAEKRRMEAERARRDSLDRIALANQARNAQMARDSAESASAAMSARQKAANDSLAAKARQDSLALLASQQNLQTTQQNLAEEISKRSDAEKQLLSTGLLLLDAVYFETGKTDISINSKPYLNIIGKMLLKYPKLQIEVAGHTDNVGGADYNLGLSQGRAEAVMNYLIEVAPDLNGRLTAKGYGFTRPKASNSTAEGRKLNRRTELEVTNKDALKEYNPQ